MSIHFIWSNSGNSPFTPSTRDKIASVVKAKVALASLTIALSRGKVLFNLPDSGGGTGIAMTPAYKQPQKAAITSNPDSALQNVV
ncbi:hypothetical protein CWATWH8502_2249 [Crocosphaera watsonii WH 8502]|uniref:Uncharacterized protein n=1 Tax=Crocosphaera watsonii WH 8502 TaxID=423474 RepID=T2IHU9_CROWT|nr:hypothetical protein CWATWH8502_2249 [Crocosphaera watsonii WH 8502]